MIITLNSTNQNNYQFRNYFNETLSLKQGSMITVKNIKATKHFYIDITDGSNQFQMAFDHASHGPYTFTIPAGRYDMQGLEDAMNEAYDQADFGYDIRWVVDKVENSLGKMKWEVNGYTAPPAVPYLPIDPYNSTYITAVNTQVVGLEISKTSAVAGLNNNSFLYKSYLSNKAKTVSNYPANWAPKPPDTKFGLFSFGVNGTPLVTSNLSFGLVPHDWDGTVLGCINHGILVSFVGERRRLIVYEGGELILDFSQNQNEWRSQGLGSADDKFVIRQYNGVANQQSPTAPFHHIYTQEQRNYWGGFAIGVSRSAGGRTKYTWINDYFNKDVTDGAGGRHSLNENSLFYPVWFFEDQVLSVIDVFGNMISTNPETNHNISNSVITQDFINTDKTTVSAVVGSVQTITSDQTLSGNNVCASHSTTAFSQGHITFNLHSASKEYFVGFSTDSSVVSTASILYGYKFGGGNVYVIDNGTISGVSKTTFTSNDLFKISITGVGFPLLEKKTGGSGDYEIVDIPHDVGAFHGDPVYCIVGFPDQVNSADTYVKIHEESTASMYGQYGVGGSYVSFSPNTLADSLGFIAETYEYDKTTDHLPFAVSAENLIDFGGADSTNTKTYRVQCPNLPVKSYNGGLGASDKTIATLALDKNGDVRFPIEQRTECLNGDDILINEIEVEITDEQNTLASTDFIGNCQITLQIEPHLNP